MTPETPTPRTYTVRELAEALLGLDPDDPVCVRIEVDDARCDTSGLDVTHDGERLLLTARFHPFPSHLLDRLDVRRPMERSATASNPAT